jgi:hypothetical protein
MKIITNRPTLQVERCPYLGLHDDSSTALGYASPWNYCYRAVPASSVRLEHQSQTCLEAGYAHCAVLLSDRRRPLPRRLRGKAEPPPTDAEPGRGRLLLIVLTLLAAALLVVLHLRGLLPEWEWLRQLLASWRFPP